MAKIARKRKMEIDWVLIGRMLDNAIGSLVDNRPVVAYDQLRRLQDFIAEDDPAGGGGRRNVQLGL